jgi:hypothetical protein
MTTFIITFAIIFLCYLVIQSTPASQWIAPSSLTHSLVQSIATLIALFAGSAALYRYYTTQSGFTKLLFMGIGFMGTTVIDAYHAVVTASWFSHAFPNIPHTVAEWSWLSTRAFLSILFLLSLPSMFRKNEAEAGAREKIIYTMVGILTVLILVVFISLPIPYPVYPEDFIARPLEMIPGLFFLIALFGYLYKGLWKTEALDFWIVLFLIMSVCTQFFFIGLSKQSHDALYIAAHVFKSISYAMIYIGVTS